MYNGDISQQFGEIIVDLSMEFFETSEVLGWFKKPSPNCRTYNPLTNLAIKLNLVSSDRF